MYKGALFFLISLCAQGILSVQPIIDTNLSAQNAGKFDFVNNVGDLSYLDFPLGQNVSFQDISGQTVNSKTLQYAPLGQLPNQPARTITIQGKGGENIQ